jgi:hypothetical protein
MIYRTLGLVLLSLLLSATGHAETVAPINVTAKSFGCITKLTPVRGFYVGNLKGDLAATLKAARAPNGSTYPPGSVVQLVPTEVMVKQSKGFNAATHDWEFFDIAVSKEGTSILKRGFAETVNRFGGNCFACHVKAEAKWDSICESGHGCDPIPVTPAMVKALQHTDPRCEGADRVSAEDAAALAQLADMMKPKAPATRKPD